MPASAGAVFIPNYLIAEAECLKCLTLAVCYDQTGCLGWTKLLAVPLPNKAIWESCERKMNEIVQSLIILLSTTL